MIPLRAQLGRRSVTVTLNEKNAILLPPDTPPLEDGIWSLFQDNRRVGMFEVVGGVTCIARPFFLRDMVREILEVAENIIDRLEGGEGQIHPRCGMNHVLRHHRDNPKHLSAMLQELVVLWKREDIERTLVNVLSSSPEQFAAADLGYQTPEELQADLDRLRVVFAWRPNIPTA